MLENSYVTDNFCWFPLSPNLFTHKLAETVDLPIYIPKYVEPGLLEISGSGLTIWINFLTNPENPESAKIWIPGSGLHRVTRNPKTEVFLTQNPIQNRPKTRDFCQPENPIRKNSFKFIHNS